MSIFVRALVLFVVLSVPAMGQDRALRGDSWAYFEDVEFSGEIPGPKEILGHAIEERLGESEPTWAERDVEDRVPGAMMRVAVDTSHPLAAGCGEWYGVIKRNMRRLAVSDSGEVIARYDGSIGGVISERNLARLEGSAFMTRHRLGSGSVICLADDVTIRGFLPMRLLTNAVVYGASLG